MNKDKEGMYLILSPAAADQNDFEKQEWYKIDLNDGKVEENKNRTFTNVGLTPKFPNGTNVKVRISI